MQNYEEDEEGHKTYPELTDGATVTMGGVIGSYKRINTRSGAPMAFISVEDLYGSIECVAFPNVYEKIRSIVIPDKIVRLSGKIQLDDEKAPVIILDRMQEFTGDGPAAAQNIEASAKPREHALWLNASALTEEEFDELTALFSNYMNGDSVVKIKRGGKLYRMTHINDCRGLRDELDLYLREDEIVRV